jgi:hypothetical protein
MHSINTDQQNALNLVVAVNLRVVVVVRQTAGGRSISENFGAHSASRWTCRQSAQG